MRTVFTSITVGQVIQQVLPVTQWLLRMIDLRSCPAASRAGRCAELLQDELRQRFDLARGPLVRALLVKLDDEEHQLLLTIHHIVGDGWSMALLINEINQLYKANLQNTAANLPVLPIQYSDFTRWQAEWLASEAASAAQEFWLRQLSGELRELALPYDRPKTGVSSCRGGTCHFEVPAELAAKLKDLSREQHVTLYVALLAAWKTLLARITGQTDIIIGTPAATRSQPEVQDLIGCLINTLVMRTSLGGEPTVGELFKRIRVTAHDAFAQRDYPYVELMRQLARAGKASHSLYNVMFAWQNTPVAEFDLPGLETELLFVDTGAAKFDLLLAMQETSAGLTGTIEYREGNFDHATVERLVRALLAILSDFVIHGPHAKVATLPALQQLAVGSGSGQTPQAYHGHVNFTGAKQPDELALPSHQIERRLSAIWQECFGLPRIGLRDNFFDLGGDSLLATALLARMEREFQQTFSIAILLERPTVQQLADWLRSDRRVREFSSLVMLQPGSGRSPLFIMPGIHGSLWEFRKLAGLLDPALPVYGLEPRGLDGLLVPDQSIAAMADHYVREITRVQPSGPYYLAGYSLGGPVAYEMAQRLRAAGHQVALLCMIDSPTRGHSRPMRLLQSFVNHSTRLTRAAYNRFANIFGCKRWEDHEELLNELDELTPGRELVFHTHRAALDRYSPQPYPGRVTVLRAAIPPWWPKRYFDDTSRQWLNYAPGEVEEIPGSHYTLFEDQYIGHLAEKLMHKINQAQKERAA